MTKKGTTKKTTAKKTVKAEELKEVIENTVKETAAPDKIISDDDINDMVEKVVDTVAPDTNDDDLIELVVDDDKEITLEGEETLKEDIEEPEEEEAIELIDEPSEEDKEMVEDVVNIINGLSGIRSGDKKKVISTTEEKETERPLDTAKKEEQGQTFSNAWGGVIYDY